MNLAIGQVFVANLANNTALLGLYQGSYGIGGIVGPLVATALISKGVIWSRFYFVELGFAGLNLFLLPWTFWHYGIESESLLPPQPSEEVENAGERANFQRKLQSVKTLFSSSLIKGLKVRFQAGSSLSWFSSETVMLRKWVT